MKAEGRVKTMLLSFLLSALDGGQWSGSGRGRFGSNERFPVQIASEAGWTTNSVWTLWRRQ